jgi:hypothetical protein
MVFLALTRKGYDSHQYLEGKEGNALWLSAGILSKTELAVLRESGANVTDFNYAIEPSDKETISCAVDTIKEHHPHETIWVET